MWLAIQYLGIDPLLEDVIHVQIAHYIFISIKFILASN